MPGRAWTADEKIRIVLESMNTNISLAELCRKYNLSPGVFYQWKEKFMKGGKLALAGQLKDPAKEKEAEINRLKVSDKIPSCIYCSFVALWACSGRCHP